MSQRLSWLLCLFLVCFALCSSALADSGSGLLNTFKEWNEKYNENTESNYDIIISSEPDELFEEDLYYEDSGMSLMSLKPEDIDNGAVQVYMTSLPQGDTSYEYSNAWLYTKPVSSSSAINCINTFQAVFPSLPRDSTDTTVHWFDRITIDGTGRGTSEPLFDKGDVFDFSMSEIVCYWEGEREVYSGSSIKKFYLNDSGTSYYLQLVLHDINGNFEKFVLDDYFIKPSGNGFYFSGTSPVLPFDVYKITFELVYTINGAFGVSSSYLIKNYNEPDKYPRYYLNHHIGFINSILNMEEVDQSTGFLSSIVAAVNNIWTAIVNLPKNIVNFVVDGLESLFIPEDGFFDGYVERWDTFFAEHFGFVYTSIDCLIDLFTSLIGAMDMESDGLITVPECTFNFVGTEFTFGGWEIDVIPEGMGQLQSVLRFVTNILFTLLFVNMGYRKFTSLIESKGE